MRRVLGLIGLIGLGVLIGFMLRLVWPRRKGSIPPVYDPPGVRDPRSVPAGVGGAS